MALFILISLIGLILGFAHGGKKRTPAQRTHEQKQEDELITIILPTITKDS